MLLSTDPSVKAQHLAVRNHVGWYDFTHHLVEVKGPDALTLLDKVCVAPIYKAPIGASTDAPPTSSAAMQNIPICDRYRSDAPSSPSGPPYCEMTIAASCGFTF